MGMDLEQAALAVAGGVYATGCGLRRIAAGGRCTQKKNVYYHQEYSTIVRSSKLRWKQIKNIPTKNCSYKNGKNLSASAAR